MKSVPEDRFKELLRAERVLQALQASGVDNWEFYDDALEDIRKEGEYEDKLSDLLDELCECLCTGVEQPAGQGCGYGFSASSLDSALEVLKAGIKELKK